MSASCEQRITLAGDLHARPAGALAVAAGRFASAVSVTAGGQSADAKSVLGVMGLGATSGQHVTVSAAGPDAQEAVAALITILGEATKVGGLPAGSHRLPRRASPGDRGNVKLHGHHGSLGKIIFLSRIDRHACPAVPSCHHCPDGVNEANRSPLK
jgi:phosphocarrier protein HPr